MWVLWNGKYEIDLGDLPEIILEKKYFEQENIMYLFSLRFLANSDQVNMVMMMMAKEIWWWWWWPRKYATASI